MSLFIKRNPLPGSDSLECERLGLQLIEKYYPQHGLKTPQVIALEDDELRLEKIDAAEGTPQLFAELGRKLAALHRVRAEKFGWERDNFIGLNRQWNVWHGNWGEFFVEYRLERQVGLIERKILKAELQDLLDKNKAGLVRFLNRHAPQPSLLHGDLWAGNVLFSKTNVYVIDPAVYYGDRECDTAMTRLFGGFAGAFYEAYERAWPLPDGHQERVKIYNLYHYLNHYNLFGEGYLSGVRQGFETIDRVAAF